MTLPFPLLPSSPSPTAKPNPDINSSLNSVGKKNTPDINSVGKKNTPDINSVGKQGHPAENDDPVIKSVDNIIYGNDNEGIHTKDTGPTSIKGKTDAMNKAHSKMLDALPSIAKWQGSKRQEESWDKFGEPPLLKSLPRGEWKSCSDYTDEEKKQLDKYSDYWNKRLAGDKALTEHLDYMQTQYGKPKDVADKAKESHKQFGCDYYSIGLSGPFNGINDLGSKEWMQLQGTKLAPPSKDYTGVTDLSGSCTFESYVRRTSFRP